MTASQLNDLMFADLMGGVVVADRNEAGAIIGYSLSEFGEVCVAFDDAASLYGEGVA